METKLVEKQDKKQAFRSKLINTNPAEEQIVKQVLVPDTNAGNRLDKQVNFWRKRKRKSDRLDVIALDRNLGGSVHNPDDYVTNNKLNFLDSYGILPAYTNNFYQQQNSINDKD